MMLRTIPTWQEICRVGRRQHRQASVYAPVFCVVLHHSPSGHRLLLPRWLERAVTAQSAAFVVEPEGDSSARYPLRVRSQAVYSASALSNVARVSGLAARLSSCVT